MSGFVVNTLLEKQANQLICPARSRPNRLLRHTIMTATHNEEEIFFPLSR
jgi:hypothetical protein